MANNLSVRFLPLEEYFAGCTYKQGIGEYAGEEGAISNRVTQSLMESTT